MTDGDGVASGSRSEALPPAEIMTKRLTVGRAVDSSKECPKDEPESVGGLVIGNVFEFFWTPRPLAPPHNKKDRKRIMKLWVIGTWNSPNTI
jgi:hypothetical protein